MTLEDELTRRPGTTTEESERSEADDDVASISSNQADDDIDTFYESEAGQREKQQFMRDLFEFMKRRGTPITRIPQFGHSELDLFKLYREVIKAGGYDAVVQAKGWKRIARRFKLPATITAASSTLKRHYNKNLYAYEQVHFFNKSDRLHDGEIVRPVEPEKEQAVAKQQQQQATTYGESSTQKRDYASAIQLPQDVVNVSGSRVTRPFRRSLKKQRIEDIYLLRRLECSLESKIDTEIDWAIKKLASISADVNSPYPALLQQVFGLLDNLIHFIMEHINAESNRQQQQQQQQYRFFNNVRIQDRNIERRAFECLLVLRNLSFVEKNQEAICQSDECIWMLIQLLNPRRFHAEWRLRALEVLISVSSGLNLKMFTNSHIDSLLVESSTAYGIVDNAEEEEAEQQQQQQVGGKPLQGWVMSKKTRFPETLPLLFEYLYACLRPQYTQGEYAGTDDEHYIDSLRLGALELIESLLFCTDNERVIAFCVTQQIIDKIVSFLRVPEDNRDEEAEDELRNRAMNLVILLSKIKENSLNEKVAATDKCPLRILSLLKHGHQSMVEALGAEITNLNNLPSFLATSNQQSSKFQKKCAVALGNFCSSIPSVRAQLRDYESDLALITMTTPEEVSSTLSFALYEVSNNGSSGSSNGPDGYD